MEEKKFIVAIEYYDGTTKQFRFASLKAALSNVSRIVLDNLIWDCYIEQHLAIKEGDTVYFYADLTPFK